MNWSPRWQHRCNLLPVPSADDYTQTVNRYIELVAKGGADELTALYAEDATIEDPIGSDVRRGRAAVHEFYAAFENLRRESELVSLRVAGNEAAFLWRLTLTTGDDRTRIEPISLMTFDDDAKITSMRAFWSPADLKVL
jgi:steroid Delta-isomerase